MKGKTFDSGEPMTLIGEGAQVHGQLGAKGSLRVDGSVDGDITGAVFVEIGKKGRVKGTVAAEFEGDMAASRHVEILAGARLKGKLRTPKLRVEDGAFFEGTCSMRDAAGEMGVLR
jgi:cytoskeletal protein CcmA (bactofilin family)